MSTTTTVTVRNPPCTTYLLSDVARQTRSKSALSKEKTTDPKTKLRSDSDQPTGSSVVEGIQNTISRPPPVCRAEDKKQTSTPAARTPHQSNLLLRRFNSANIKISPSGDDDVWPISHMSALTCTNFCSSAYMQEGSSIHLRS